MVSVPTEEDFRKIGYTAAAVNYPLNEQGFLDVCRWNGWPVDKAPNAARYAPNAAVQQRINAGTYFNWELKK